MNRRVCLRELSGLAYSTLVAAVFASYISSLY